MSFPRYPAYKPSGVEWLGEVPEHWDILPLKRRSRLLTEKTECRDNPVALENIEGWTGRFVETDTEFQGEGIAFETGDILFGKLRPYLAKVYLAAISGQAVGDFHVIHPLGGLNSRFLQLALLTRELIYLVNGSTFGAKMPRASWDFLGSLPLCMPPLDEQHAIASFLDRETAKIDALIAEQQRLIELLQEKRQAVISQAVTKGLNPSAPMKDSGVEWLGEVPEHWHTQRLKNLFSLKHGYAFDGNCFSDAGEFALMSPGNFKEAGGFRRKEPEKYYTGQDVPCDFILKEGQMLIAMTEQAPGLVGAALFVPESQCYLHNQRLGLVTGLKEESLDSAFLYWLMNSPTMKAKVGVTATGQKVRHTSPQKILEIEACLPPLGEQRLIAKTLCESEERFELLANAARDAVKLLSERRSALISAAVTGQIDVRGLVEAEAGEQ